MHFQNAESNADQMQQDLCISEMQNQMRQCQQPEGAVTMFPLLQLLLPTDQPCLICWMFILDVHLHAIPAIWFANPDTGSHNTNKLPIVSLCPPLKMIQTMQFLRRKGIPC
jgi:hypothetical protein